MKNFFNTANLELGMCIALIIICPALIIYFLYDAFGWDILLIPGMFLAFITIGYIYRKLFCAKDTRNVNKVQ